MIISAPGPFEILIILVVAILIFGKRLPEIGRSMGKSLVEFKKGLQEVKDTKETIENEVKNTVLNNSKPENTTKS
jgi:sec-independent protein translocase protein TatA